MKSGPNRCVSVLTFFPFALFVTLALPLVARAGQPERTWRFDLEGPGTYEVHVRHEYQGTTIPPRSEATYTFQAGDKTVTRTLPFYPHDPTGNGLPVGVLMADITSPQTASVIISGIPQPLLQRTRVYVIDRNSRYLDEWFDPSKSVNLESAKRLRDILARPEDEIDLAETKLVIDNQIDPTVDVNGNLQKIDAMAARIKTMPGYGRSHAANLLALRRYLYEPGEWNNYKPFQYDLEDPLGTNMANKLLPRYLETKKGNCVTMPFLFLILGQRVGIDVTASTAPLHIFVKVKDEQTGDWQNLETTSGANPTRDAWYRKQTPMTDQAVANGVYLRPLTKKETAALMTTTLAEHYYERKEYEKTITISDLILDHDPKNAETMVRKASAYYGLLRRYYLAKFPALHAIPERLHGHFHFLSNNNRAGFIKAEALGWREPRKDEEEKYLQSINNAKAKQ